MQEKDIIEKFVTKIDNKLENTYENTSMIIESLISIRADIEQILFIKNLLEDIKTKN